MRGMLMKGVWITVVLLPVLTLPAGATHAQSPKKTLVVALNQDPDILDPSLSRRTWGASFTSTCARSCTRLTRISKIFPQLAAALPTFADGGKTVTIKLRSGVKFNDGTPMNAEAVRFSGHRHLNLKGSGRRSELELVTAIEVVDPLTVRLRLKAPFSPILATLAHRWGGMPSPPCPGQEAGRGLGTAPVCAGALGVCRASAPGSDRPGEVQALLRPEPGQVRPDRVPNHRRRQRAAGQPALWRYRHDAPGRADRCRQPEEGGRFEVSSVTGLHYQSITINLHNKNGKNTPPVDLGTPLADDPRFREALDLSIDREALDQVAWDGQYTPGCTPISPVSPFYDKGRKCPIRDVAKAKKLLADAGLAGGYSFEMTIINDPQQRRVGEIIQGMAKEAGFNISLRPAEFASALKDDDDGNLRAFVVGWSGRVDPDGNIHQFHTCGGSLNTTGACDKAIDDLLNKAREVSNQAQRAAPLQTRPLTR